MFYSKSVVWVLLLLELAGVFPTSPLNRGRGLLFPGLPVLRLLRLLLECFVSGELAVGRGWGLQWLVMAGE